MATQLDTRPPLTFPADHCPDVSRLRYDCQFRRITKGKKKGQFEPGCGPGQRITNAYERDRSHMTGSSLFLKHRCAGCGEDISGSVMDSRLVTKEESE